MTLAILAKYADYFRALRTNYTHEHNQSPHKFIVLLSLIRLYDSGSLKSEKIQFSDELLSTWQNVFQQEWIKWVKNPYHKMNFAMPLYYLRSVPFWRFYLQDGAEDKFGKSLKNLRESVDYILLDTELAALFRQPETRELLKDVLLAKLFEILDT